MWHSDEMCLDTFYRTGGIALEIKRDAYLDQFIHKHRGLEAVS